MLLGLGTDLVDIQRLNEVMQHHGELFLQHFLTEREQNEAKARKISITYIAGRWAAKEAVSKMLGCGIGAKCAWLDMEILDTPTGAPELFLSGAAAETAKKTGIERILISISHENNYATATAVGEGK